MNCVLLAKIDQVCSLKKKKKKKWKMKEKNTGKVRDFRQSRKVGTTMEPRIISGEIGGYLFIIEYWNGRYITTLHFISTGLGE